MKDRMVRSITLAVVAAFSIGISANAQATTDNDKVISDETTSKTTLIKKNNFERVSYVKCAPQKVRKVAYHRCGKRHIAYHASKLVALAPSFTKETRIEHTKVLERPAVIEQKTVMAPPQQVIMTQPAVIEQPAETPVIIDRYVSRHRSLIHLGLFPFNLFGQ